MSLARSTERSRSAKVDQHQVAHRVAELVVDRLEAVEVGDQHAGRGALAAAALEGVPQPVLEEEAVGQAGQRVVQRAVDQLRLERLPLGDVLDDHHQVGGLALRRRRAPTTR